MKKLSVLTWQKGNKIMPVQEKEKFTLTVDENDILTLSQKIQKNKDEDRAFAEKLEKYLSNVEKTTEPLLVGSTPNALAISGANPDLRVVIAPRTIAKCMAESDEQYHGHGLSADIMKQLPEQLRNPAMIFKGNKDNSLVVITELKDKENREIMIAVNLNEVSGRQEVNRISSAYGRNNMTNFLKEQMEQGNLISCNKEKANEMLQSAGLQLPLEETFISFDNSIAYSEENVKTISAKNSIENAEKLLPFLNAKYRHHLNQIDNFNEKKAECIDKINYRQAKIDKLTAKVKRLEQTNKTLKALFSDSILSSAVNAYTNRNEAKIKKINEERIPKHSKKIDIQYEKTKQLDHKIEVKQCKADKLYHLSNLIKSFFTLNGTKRHNQFMSSLKGLNDASQRSLKFKLDKCNSKISNLNKQYQLTESISKKLTVLQSRQTDLSNKIKRLQKVYSTFPVHSPETIDKLIDKTENQISEAIKAENLNVAELADDISVSSAEYLHDSEKSIDNKENEITHQEKQNKVHDNERKLYEKINPEYYEALKSEDIYMKKVSDDIADSIMQQLDEKGIRFSAVRLANDITGVTVHKDFQEAFDKAMNKGIQEHKEKLIQNKKQAKSYNSEYYISLPKENRLISEFPTHEANQYINALKTENCKYSYRIKQADRIAVTIDNRDNKAIGVYDKFVDNMFSKFTIEEIKNELRERGFSEEKIGHIDICMGKYENLSDKTGALETFSSHISPDYSFSQISQISNIVAEIFSQSEMDRLRDTNGLHNQLIDLIKNFDYEVNLNQLTQNCNFDINQKNELLNALKSDISAETLQRLDESYSAEEIHNFVDVYKSYDMDKIEGFFKNHNKSCEQQQSKKEVTFSRKQMKANAERVGKEKSEPKAKAIEHSI